MNKHQYCDCSNKTHTHTHSPDIPALNLSLELSEVPVCSTHRAGGFSLLLLSGLQVGFVCVIFRVQNQRLFEVSDGLGELAHGGQRQPSHQKAAVRTAAKVGAKDPLTSLHTAAVQVSGLISLHSL